jgi:calcineurin-like phosphoesterase family protein
MIMAATRRSDDMHALMADFCWRASVAHGSSDEGITMDDFHTLRERVSVMRINYQQFLIDKDYLLRMGEMYHEALREQELEVDRLTQELESTRGFLRGTQTALQESKV